MQLPGWFYIHDFFLTNLVLIQSFLKLFAWDLHTIK
jgi:hypothetical protein